MFTALAVSRTVQNRTGLSLRRVLLTLKPLRSADIEINGVTQTFAPEIRPELAKTLTELTTPDSRH